GGRVGGVADVEDPQAGVEVGDVEAVADDLEVVQAVGQPAVGLDAGRDPGAEVLRVGVVRHVDDVELRRHVEQRLGGAEGDAPAAQLGQQGGVDALDGRLGVLAAPGGELHGRRGVGDVE